MLLFSALYTLRNVLIVKLANLSTVNLYVFLSALYTLQYVPIVNISCNLYINLNTKVMPQMPCYLSFLSGKGGNPYVSNPMKSYLQVHFLTFPPACNELDKASTTHLKIAQNMYIFHANFALFQ